MNVGDIKWFREMGLQLEVEILEIKEEDRGGFDGKVNMMEIFKLKPTGKKRGLQEDQDLIDSSIGKVDSFEVSRTMDKKLQHYAGWHLSDY